MIFKIMGDPEFTESFLNRFNRNFHTNFKVKEVHHDEVTFISIESNGAKNDDILKLGIEYSKVSIIEKRIN